MTQTKRFMQELTATSKAQRNTQAELLGVLTLLLTHAPSCGTRACSCMWTTPAPRLSSARWPLDKRCS